MNTIYGKRCNNLVSDFLKECFSVINNCCQTQAYGHLHFNHLDYIYMDYNNDGDYVPFVHSHGSNVEMYSEDGWNDLESIAHWTDVAIDIISAISAGCGEKYGYENVQIKVRS